MSESDKNHKGLVLEKSLQGHFFDQLQKINAKSVRPLHLETILYSSIVMGNMGESKKYFDTTKGKVRDKILGIKLMKAEALMPEKRKRELQDIGDTALLLCGYFYESVNKKIVDIGYYRELGKTAYARLDGIISEFYNLTAFFKILSDSFDQVTDMMGIVAKTFGDQENVSIFVNDQEFLKAS